MIKKYPKIITTLAICGGLIMGFNTLKTPVYANDDAQTVITNDENGIPDSVLYNALLEELDLQVQKSQGSESTEVTCPQQG